MIFLLVIHHGLVMLVFLLSIQYLIIISAMNRIYKHYYFNLVEPFIGNFFIIYNNYKASKKISFSSYPGFLVSLDGK